VEKTGAQLSILNVPGIVDNTAVKTALMSDSHLKEVFNQFEKIDVAFVGVGTPTPDSVVMRDGTILTQEQLDGLLQMGAVGDICLRFFDDQGNPIHSEIDERVLGITLEQVKKIDRVVGVTGGPYKDNAIRAALLGGLVNVLVTDHLSAKKLLKES
jgi:DNA-binding transcriptional regulator LsrR (DeoR family)